MTRRRGARCLAALAGALVVAACEAGTPWRPPARGPATGPLRVSAKNPRYFEDPSGRIVLLAGDHVWNDFQDYGYADPPSPFDFRAFLDTLVANRENFFRLWRWEQATWQTEVRERYFFAPQPYLRTGPGLANDGKPRFDLTRFDPSYFDRMRARVVEAGRRGIYVSVMLFDGWSVAPIGAGLGNPWRGHPYAAPNNVNGVDGAPDGHGWGAEAHTLRVPAVVRLEERYVAKVVETVGDLDNVLYEVSNESAPASAPWQEHLIAFVKALEARRPKRHPVGMSATFDGDDAPLWASDADWVSPSHGAVEDPPPTDGRKVVLWDTDHLCGACADRDLPWMALTRGANPVFMDPFDSTAPEMDADLRPPVAYDPRARRWSDMRRNLGYALAWAERMGLERAAPAPSACSTRFCLVVPPPGARALVYAPHRGEVSVDLAAAPGRFGVEWLSPRTGHVLAGADVDGGARRTFRTPFLRDAVLYLWEKRPAR
ncbi:MAG TPA: DUF6298 domain-containing protein [Gemmatimonadales bacterium]|nr:DUF6298 domain-containing protein [Gemmatimonadales bacterium]